MGIISVCWTDSESWGNLTFVLDMGQVQGESH